jgi:hypothetical protein
MPKYARFNAWLIENGVRHPSVDYPVAFGKHGQLIGMAASKDVPPLKAFLSVPCRLIITEQTVMKSNVAHIILKHPEIFKSHHDSEYLTLGLFIMHEILKGEESFWYPYLEIINFSDLPMLWTKHEIEELQD